MYRSRRARTGWALLATFVGHLVMQALRERIYLDGLDNRVGAVHLLGTPPDAALAVILALAHGAVLVTSFLAFRRIVESHARARDVRAVWLPLSLAAAVALGLAMTRPCLSIDVTAYLAHGRVAAMGHNPHLFPLHAASASLAPDLAPLGWRPIHGPSPYGPVVTTLERAVACVDDARLAMLLWKAVMIAAIAACAAIIGRAGAIGSILVLCLHPTALVEVAAEGHNDALMALGVVASIAAAHRGRAATCGALLALAVGVKYVPLLLVPLLLAYFARASGRRGVLRFASGLLAGGAIVALLALPYLPLGALFDGVRRNDAMPYYVSVGAAIARVVPLRAADLLLKLALLAVIALFTARVRDRASLVRGAILILTFYQFVVSKQLYAWYAIAPVALAALDGSRTALRFAMALTLPVAILSVLETIDANRVLSADAARFAWNLRLYAGAFASALGAAWVARAWLPLPIASRAPDRMRASMPTLP